MANENATNISDVTEKYFFIFLLIFLFGCGSKVDIENVIKLNLNDPDSVKFKQGLVDDVPLAVEG